jgi:Domain of unknown function (DUF5911)
MPWDAPDPMYDRSVCPLKAVGSAFDGNGPSHAGSELARRELITTGMTLRSAVAGPPSGMQRSARRCPSDRWCWPCAGKGYDLATFPPIADYAFLSNCEQSCLVAPDGAIEWLCLPRPDSPSVFGALLDRAARGFRFGPTTAQVPQHRRYVPGTLVLETTWHTASGWLVVQDLLVMGGSASTAAARITAGRPPTSARWA